MKVLGQHYSQETSIFKRLSAMATYVYISKQLLFSFKGSHNLSRKAWLLPACFKKEPCFLCWSCSLSAEVWQHHLLCYSQNSPNRKGDFAECNLLADLNWTFSWPTKEKYNGFGSILYYRLHGFMLISFELLFLCFLNLTNSKGFIKHYSLSKEKAEQARLLPGFTFNPRTEPSDKGCGTVKAHCGWLSKGK